MAEQNSNLNKILQKQGDFLGRKFNAIKDYTDTAINEAIQVATSDLEHSISSTAKSLSGSISAAQSAAINASKSYTDTQISNVIGGAPETLDTLKELADALTSSDSVLNDVKDAIESHRHDNATQTADGFMSKEDKAFLDSIGTYEQFVAAFNAAVGAESPFYEK